MPARLPDGRIAFVSDRDGASEIYLADPSGRSVARLTADPPVAGRPAASAPAPLGRDRIVFARTDPGAPPGAPRDLYVIRLDGSGLRRLTRGADDDSAPAGSPDGRSVVFVSDRSGAPHLYLMAEVDAADPEAGLVDLSRAAPPAPGSPAASLPYADGAPAFLPDGSIVFSRTPDGGRPHLFHLGTAGPRFTLRQITDSITLPYGADEPVLLQDGSLLFVTGGTERPASGKDRPVHAAVYRITLGGFNLVRVTRDQARYSDFTRRLPPRP